MPWWRQRKTLVGGAAVLLGLTAVVYAVAFRGPTIAADDFPELPRTADPISRPRTLTSVPKDCGVTPRTVDALVPEARKARRCYWKGDGAELRVRMHIKGDRFAPAVVQAMDDFHSMTSADMRSVTGLGDEASATQTPEGAGVRFRTANAVLWVELEGHSGDTALKGALTVAAEVARALDSPARPRVRPGPVPGDFSFAREDHPERLPRACGLLSGDDLDDLARDARPSRGGIFNADGLSPDKLLVDQCSWRRVGGDDVDAPERNVSLSLISVGSNDPDTRVRWITREYEKYHRRFRDGHGFGYKARTERFTALCP